MSDDEFLDPSPTVLQPKRTHFEKIRNLPFDRVPVGKSFKVVKGDNLANNEVPNINVMRTTAYREGKRHGKQFVVCDHKELGCFEVYCAGLRDVSEIESKGRGRPKNAEPKAETSKPETLFNGETREQYETRIIEQGRKMFAKSVGNAGAVKPLKKYLTLTCPDCGETNTSLPIDEFAKPTDNPDQMQTHCLDCNYAWIMPRSYFEE